jgi:hypothetical protein
VASVIGRHNNPEKILETFFLVEEKHVISVQSFHEKNIYQDLLLAPAHRRLREVPVGRRVREVPGGGLRPGAPALPTAPPPAPDRAAPRARPRSARAQPLLGRHTPDLLSRYTPAKRAALFTQIYAAETARQKAAGTAIKPPGIEAWTNVYKFDRYGREDESRGDGDLGDAG